VTYRFGEEEFGTCCVTFRGRYGGPEVEVRGTELEREGDGKDGDQGRNKAHRGMPYSAVADTRL